MPIGVTLRRCIESDLPCVLAIEQASFPFPWQGDFFLKEMQLSHSWLWVAEAEGAVIGYICGWFVADEGEIVRVAVHPTARRRGIGKILLEEAMRVAHQRGAQTLHLEVRASNAEAIALYKVCGFCEIGKRTRYYENGEDALRMRWERKKIEGKS